MLLTVVVTGLAAIGLTNDLDKGIVDRLKSERVARLQEFPELSDDIVKAVG